MGKGGNKINEEYKIKETVHICLSMPKKVQFSDRKQNQFYFTNTRRLVYLN